MVDQSVELANGKSYARPSRLKYVPTDPLEELGLPSKGDNRLLDSTTQERYFAKILERYRAYHDDINQAYDLDKAFASLTVSGLSGTGGPTISPAISKPLDSPDKKPSGLAEISIIMSAMRKLREGIVASSRRDHFAKRAYILMVQAAISTRNVESYHPALLHLLGKIHPVTPLSASELHRFVGYYVLHLASYEDDMVAAYSARRNYKYKDAQVDQILRAMVSGNWYTYWKVSGAMDKYQRSLLQMADKSMRKHALQCIGKSYPNVDVIYLETATDSNWKSLKEKDQVTWELEGERVVIKRPKR